MLYEGVLLFAVAFAATWIFQFAAGGPGAELASGWQRFALQAYLLLMFAAYFLWCWLRGGQTLAMKAWHIRLEARNGARLSPRLALLRFAWACLSVGAFLIAIAAALAMRNPWLAFAMLCVSGSGLGWALADNDRQFLHDRLAGTRLVMVDDKRP
ncbi:MAG: RDD family protein [Betaproteobacteria bacterium]|nr:RDD family protein [Betaproteobacteria bacterium]